MNCLPGDLSSLQEPDKLYCSGVKTLCCFNFKADFVLNLKKNKAHGSK